jgi:hypothetical protein
MGIWKRSTHMILGGKITKRLVRKHEKGEFVKEMNHI